MNTQQDSSGDKNANDIGTAYVREAGCGIRYIINLEDTDEEQFEVELDREQAEKLYAVLGRLLEKNVAPIIQTNIAWNTAPPVSLPNWVQNSNWQIPPFPWMR